jgi:hypothetical protein
VWQAQAFALAFGLSAQGHFTWKEWAAALATELADAAERGEAMTARNITTTGSLPWRSSSSPKAFPTSLHDSNAERLGRMLIGTRPMASRSSCVRGFGLITNRQSPLKRVTRADGAAKQIRIQDGHLFVCNGCCCGRTEKGFPPLALDEFKRQWKQRGIRRRLHLTISGCLGPCPLANVVLLQIHGRSLWFHSINHPEDVNSIYDYVEQMLVTNSVLDLPPSLSSRLFERYLSSAGSR